MKKAMCKICTLLVQVDFAKRLVLPNNYEQEKLDPKGVSTKSAVYLDKTDYYLVVKIVKAKFDSDVFGMEEDENFQSTLVQIGKDFGDKNFYQSIEEKAATLLYLIIKNHGFVNSNKHIAAACFFLFP